MPESPTAAHSELHASTHPSAVSAGGRAVAGIWQPTTQPVHWREPAVIGLLVLLFDLLIYRGHGYAGGALAFVAAPLLLWAGAPHRGWLKPLWILFGLLALMAARMAWLGNPGQVIAGLVLIAGVAMSLSGRTPYVLDTLLLAWQLSFAGAIRLPVYAQLRVGGGVRVQRDLWLKVLMPAGVVLIFSGLFVLANPDLRVEIERLLDGVSVRLQQLFGELVPTVPQVICWGVVAWASIGLLRPIAFPRMLGWLGPIVDGDATEAGRVPGSPLVPAFRNTLIAVAVLFAAYLVFEFQSLWFRTFPAGFYYAGYAHEGAAWLTVALALATLVLSAIFRGGVQSDPRLPQLKRLAWVWSALNILLAVAVYHRLSIYVGFNGMTRMRMVGIVGVTTVLAGFLLVVWKIARDRGFLWLIERQLWALALGLYVLAVLPMDALIHRYNTARILAGDAAPAVQMTEHNVDASGLAALTPLLDCKDPIIRDGVTARLAKEWFARQAPAEAAAAHWTAYQQAEQDLLAKLSSVSSRFGAKQAASDRDAAWQRFRDYAYQWY